MNRRDIITSGLAAGTVATLVTARPAAAQQPKRAPAIRARDGTFLFHRDWGEGHPVVFVSSWALTSEMWAYQVAQLSEGYRCVAYDRRGHGRSDPASAGYEIDNLADDLGRVIDTLGLKDVTLVGHSMGCSEIVRYLARHGTGKVRSVAMLAPATPYLVKTADNPYGAPMAAYDQLIATWKTGFHKWMRDNQAPFFTPETPTMVQDWLTGQMLTTPLPVAIATFRANLGDRRPDLAKVDRPTLILHGDKDASAFLDFTGRRVAAGIRGSELKVYPGAPHGLFVTHMEQVNRDLEAFLKA